MIAENVFFGVIAAAMAISALGVVTTKNVVHAALFLVIVLFLFGIMLTRAPMHPDEGLGNNLMWPAAAAALFLAGILGGLFVHTFHGDEIELERPIRTIQVTNAIFRVYIIPFEIVGVLLLGALVGAVVLARRD